MRNVKQLQELYRHLDHVDRGNVYLAWYAQCRATEMSHADALEATIEYFGLRNKEWYKKRMERRAA